MTSIYKKEQFVLEDALSAHLNWRVLDSRYPFGDRWLTLRTDRCETGQGTVVETYHVLELPDWVNVIAITKEEQIVLVREYRHGIGKVMLGLPSGTMDETDSSPQIAASRELAEETGYAGGEWFLTSSVPASSARQDNIVHSFLAIGVEYCTTPKLDATEDIEVVTMALSSFLESVAKNEIELTSSHRGAIFSLLAPIALNRENSHAISIDHIRNYFRSISGAR